MRRRCRTRSAPRFAPSSSAAAACSRRSRPRSTTRRGAGASNFGLAELFGVSFAGRIDGPMQNSYLNLETDPADRRAASGPRRASTTRRASSTASSGVQVTPTTGVPVAAHADSDLSRTCRWRTSIRASRAPTRASCICAHAGRGRVAYVPWDIDRTFWDVMCVDHGRLMRNAVRVGGQRTARRSRSSGPGAPRRDGLAAARFDDGAPGQPDEPDDDEGTAARDRSRSGRCSVAHSAARGRPARKVQLLTAGTPPPRRANPERC